MPFAPYPMPPLDPELDRVAAALDPVLQPLGFASGQAGGADGHAQVIFCRGVLDDGDGACVDLVVELAASPAWHVTGVRYWGYPSDRWQLAFDSDGDLGVQLEGLARTLPDALA